MPSRPRFLIAGTALLTLFATEIYLARLLDRGDFLIHVLLDLVLFGLVFGPIAWFTVFRPLLTRETSQENELNLLSRALTATSNAVFITDRAGNIAWANEAFSKLCGYEIEEILGRNPRFLQSGLQSPSYYKEMWATILSGQSWISETLERHKNGHTYTVRQTITPIMDELQQITHFIAMHDDITAMKEAEARIHRIAHHDALTGLSNRILFKDRLKQALRLAKRNKEALALLYIDLDRFKPVNDTLGHAVGDMLLKAVAKRLRRCVRDSDTVSRLGGDEFTVILPTINQADDAGKVAMKIIQALEKPFSIQGHEIRIGSSIGIAIYMRDSDNAGDLMQMADAAMYVAKTEGRNTYRFYAAPQAESGDAPA
ncbi:PAS domain S-box-containing protein/diguanylate cyclase (GGDEF)-like protein [Sulfuritortus calidifontis]|uniref:PAS domain S-box-containing protein/diguanylate cyclase (GGDEF)-like protein n=1 Tax=Sulfuritortus calidifontis TaxID=1914471 RepID=A0A4R3JX02_9PROT|nr:diguanylate cyclase [Sulfuritortus calidifontis]TCS72953.1 PAS domain S-box-containing protein/diguanylate cyclase (GGDEF)-like protein [Sulfuritortus calidifontis]